MKQKVRLGDDWVVRGNSKSCVSEASSWLLTALPTSLRATPHLTDSWVHGHQGLASLLCYKARRVSRLSVQHGKARDLCHLLDIS